MSRKNFDLITFEQFVTHYMKSPANLFAYQAQAIQIYPLSMAEAFIRPPTRLFKARYSFLLLFLAGGGQQQVDNEILPLRANDVLFIREGHLNAIRTIEAGTQGFYVHIPGPLLPHIFPTVHCCTALSTAQDKITSAVALIKRTDSPFPLHQTCITITIGR